MGENLFNGIWRFRVIAFELVTVGKKAAYDVTIEFRNGTTKTLSLQDTRVTENSDRGINLILEDQQTLIPEKNLPLPTGRWTPVARKALPQGGLNKHTFRFFVDSADIKPIKFLFEIDPSLLPEKIGFKYTVDSPSFRVDLTCTK